MHLDAWACTNSLQCEVELSYAQQSSINVNDALS